MVIVPNLLRGVASLGKITEGMATGQLKPMDIMQGVDIADLGNFSSAPGGKNGGRGGPDFNNLG